MIRFVVISSVFWLLDEPAHASVRFGFNQAVGGGIVDGMEHNRGGSLRRLVKAKDRGQVHVGEDVAVHHHMRRMNTLEQMTWLLVPFSTLAAWIFTTMEKIGESTESPFEGSANDVPIKAMNRAIEIDLRQMLGDTDVPPAIGAQNNILL